MFDWLTKRRRERSLAKHAIPDEQWQRALNELPFLERYDPELMAKLRELSTLFLIEKGVVSGATDGESMLEVTPHMRIMIAVQACLLILGQVADGKTVADAMSDFDDWENVVVYPGEFPQTQDFEDEYGVVHKLDEAVAGESWEGGPVLLSWPAVEAGYEESGMALVIHEFAHKIDMLDGQIDGIPPLPAAERAEFKAVIEAAFEDFCARVDADEDTLIDPYASEMIEEFFAVSCEVFFAEPELLSVEYPAYFSQLRAFFKIDPVAGTWL
ncbi:MAG: zinc-dependent peptidase [Betaproteobacteria bacterium]|nr:MAG: zinc-dependent peptidase [Betaproteobacteria bacterium]